MEPTVIETEKYKFRVFPVLNYMEYIVKPDVLIDAPDVREGKRLIIERWPDIKFYVFAEGLEFFTLSKEARALSASKEYSDNHKAVAFLTTNVSLLLLGKLYLKIDKPCIPTKIFSDRNEARYWLEEQMKKDSARRRGQQ